MERKLIALLLVATVSAGCVRRLHDRCRGDADCMRGATCGQFLGLIGYEEGTGTCEVVCDGDEDCPPGTACSTGGLDVSGPICLEVGRDDGTGSPRKFARLHEACGHDVMCVHGWCHAWTAANGKPVQQCEMLCSDSDPPSTACPDGYRCEQPAEGPGRCFAAR